MEFYSKIPYKTIEDGIITLFKNILSETKSDSGSIFVFDEKKNIIFKSLFNIKMSIESLDIGKIDKWIIKKKKMYRISNFSEIPELKIYSKKNSEIKESIIYPIYLNDILLALINLNKTNSLFLDKDIKKVKDYEKILVSILSSVYFVEKNLLQQESFNNYILMIDIILDSFEKSKTQEEFINKIKEEIRKRFNIDVQIERSEKKELYSIKINNEYFNVNIEYIDEIGILGFLDEKKKIDLKKFEKILQFLEKILELKKIQEQEEKISNLLIASKENMILKFTSWKVFQEINSALSGIYLNIYNIKDECQNEILEIMPSIDRIKESVETYKKEYLKTDIEKISLNKIINEIIDEINIFEIKVKRVFETDIVLYIDKKILKNTLMVLFINLFKINQTLRDKTDITVKIYKEKGKTGSIEIILKDIKIKEKDIDIDIIRQTFENFHMNLIIESDKNTKIQILIPLK
ncbi:MAG: hypothetical protein B6I29_04050 [Marinitoga sp. 4572_148]|nr:MAG: hypothetical protein B6I29_04050 [Marinitoga sp. 4572_148]